MPFPVDLSRYRPVSLDPQAASLTSGKKTALGDNIALVRDAIVFMTALSNRKGLGGHTGGAYDLVPEALLVEGFIAVVPRSFPVHFDDAGHRVALQYVLAVLHGALPPEALLRYREYDGGLPGHPEADLTPGIGFCSGRLGHLWSHVNGLALAHPQLSFILYSSDGAQQEGNNAEAARFAAAHGCRVRVLVDDNDTTISGSPSEYMHNYDVARTLAGWASRPTAARGRISTASMPGSAAPSQLRARLPWSTSAPSPRASPWWKGPPRPMTRSRSRPPWPGSASATRRRHDCSKPRKTPWSGGRTAAAAAPGVTTASSYSCRRRPRSTPSRPHSAKHAFLVVDSDLGGSCGLDTIKARHPEVFTSGGNHGTQQFFPLPPASAPAPERKASSGPSPPSRRCCSPSSPWPASTAATYSPTSPTPGWTTCRTTPATSGTNNFFATAASWSTTTRASTSGRSAPDGATWPQSSANPVCASSTRPALRFRTSSARTAAPSSLRTAGPSPKGMT